MCPVAGNSTYWLHDLLSVPEGEWEFLFDSASMQSSGTEKINICITAEKEQAKRLLLFMNLVGTASKENDPKYLFIVFLDFFKTIKKPHSPVHFKEAQEAEEWSLSTKSQAMRWSSHIGEQVFKTRDV